MTRYLIRLVCYEGRDPLTNALLPHEEETVAVEAASPELAYRKALALMRIQPQGRRLMWERVTAAGSESEAWYAAQFAIEGVQGPYPGFSRGQSWNGWAVPFFERDAALQIARDYAQLNPDAPDIGARYDVDADAFFFFDDDAEEEVEYGGCSTIISGREVTLYPIGAYEWGWVQTQLIPEAKSPQEEE